MSARPQLRICARLLPLAMLLCAAAALAAAQEPPYFVTYSHHLEEPGNLEFETSSTIGLPHSPVPGYIGHLLEFEYGVKGWWTSELYLEGQSTRGDSTIFTGWRLENRFRPLKREHFINPILYFEYESINEGSRIKKEVVGHAENSLERNADLRREHAHELEGKLILSSTVRDWNISENFIVEKNLSEAEGLEFGYALGISRPLARIASGKECRLCRENFVAGLELYGGLGSTHAFGLAETAHYLAPALRWQITDNSAIRVSPGFGLTNVSDRMLLRIGYSYEVRGFRQKVASMFKGDKQIREAQSRGGSQ
jgi:hypothetical protein